MDTIKNYLESIFLAFPETPEIDQLKSDLLANMEDRYTELKEEGQSEHEAIGTTIAEFGSIEELIEELQINPTVNNEFAYEEPLADIPNGEGIGVEEAEVFISSYRKAASQIGGGVFIILAGLGGLIFADSFYMADSFGILSLFLGIAIAVGLFIIAGMRISASGKLLDDRPIFEMTKKYMMVEKQNFQRSFTACIVIGVMLCIIWIIPMIAFDGATFVVSLMFLFIGTAVFLFIYGGMVYSSYDRFIKNRHFIADEDAMGPRAKKEIYGNMPPLLRIAMGAYWPLVVIGYFVISMIVGWGYSWLIFVVAGLLYDPIVKAYDSFK